MNILFKLRQYWFCDPKKTRIKINKAKATLTERTPDTPKPPQQGTQKALCFQNSMKDDKK
jgi:hypothetical protein